MPGDTQTTTTERTSIFDGLPMWARITGLIGFPILVAMFFMAKDVGYLPSVAESNAKEIHQLLDLHKNMPETLRVICLNTAKSLEQAQRCP